VTVFMSDSMSDSGFSRKRCVGLVMGAPAEAADALKAQSGFCVNGVFARLSLVMKTFLWLQVAVCDPLLMCRNATMRRHCAKLDVAPSRRFDCHFLCNLSRNRRGT
jgi:hypothetical protein